MAAPVPPQATFIRIIMDDSEQEPSQPIASPSVDLEHALRRAEEEAIATIRSNEPRAAERHDEMASYYSMRALELIERDNEGSVEILQRTN
ncbi:MAG: hypothetical protein ABIR77_00105 [Sphingomicrobium sp.]